MPLRKLFKSYTKLLLIILSSYTFILLGLLVLALQLSNEIKNFTSQTNKLYQHPFQVNSAARSARQSVSSLRADLLYAIIDQSNIKHAAFTQEDNSSQATLDESLKIIEINFLGDMGKISEAFTLVQQLKETRSKVITLLLNGHILEGENIIKNQATPLYQQLQSNLDYIVDYSANKALDLVQQAQQRGEAAHTKLWLLLTIFALFTLLSGAVTITIVLRNVSQRDRTLNQANENLRIAATAFETQEGMIVTSSDNKILKVNRAFCKITGYEAQEVIGKNPNILSSGKQEEQFYAQMWRDIEQQGYWEGEVYNQRKNGELYPQKLTITAVKGRDNVICNYVATLNDITLKKQAEEEIEALAYYDPLTHLPNRRLLIDRLHHVLMTNKRNECEGALLFLDLDHFKNLNDTLGHDMGDMLLKQVALRLVECIRESDTVSRFGGDEFVILIEALSPETFLAIEQAEMIACKILSSLNTTYHIAGEQFNISTSIGITLFNGKKTEVEELLKQADIALYQAKDAGRNTVKFFDPQMQKNITIRAELETQLHQAIQFQQFELYYQVQVDDAMKPFGAEALLRWHHPSRGIISPIEFISLAEQNGSILAIGEWVLNAACAQLQIWQHDPATNKLTLAINVSVKQFHQDNFVATIKTTLAHYEIKPRLLKIELTESMLLEDIEGTIIKMHELSRLGIQFSLDDFGTGYSSLQYLKQLPLHQLKIDKSFVDALEGDGRDQKIVRTIIAMAHSLGLSVIAEGVENEKQLAILFTEGCRHYQGYLFGKPEAITEFEKIFTSSNIPTSHLYQCS